MLGLRTRRSRRESFVDRFSFVVVSLVSQAYYLEQLR